MKAEDAHTSPLPALARRILAVGLLAGVLVLLATPTGASAQTTERVSVDSAGNEQIGPPPDGPTPPPSISADGRFVAFDSRATNLVPGDTNGRSDVFVHDRQTGITERMSVDGAGNQGNSDSDRPLISANGRFVAFNSRSTNLVPGDTNGTSDVFVHDRQTGTTERVSVDNTGNQGNGGSGVVAISADGRFVAFVSTATNLVPGDTNGVLDVFVHDRQTGTTERVSVDSAGDQGNSYSGTIIRDYGVTMSADGRFVAFVSAATNLVAGDTNGVADVFVHDRQTRTTERVSVDSAGTEGNGASILSEISADGRFVAFWSSATNLVPGDTNGVADVFVHDRQTRITERVSIDSAGNQANGVSTYSAISADGRFVAFVSSATNLVPGDTNGGQDVFVHDRRTGTTERVSVDSAGTESNGSSERPAISADGRFVAFWSSATNLVTGDTNGTSDVFVHDRGAPATVTTTVSFDAPAPPGGPGPFGGVFEGIDFGTGQWAWSGPYNVDSTNNVYFASSTGTSRTFAFSPAPRVLQSLRVYATRAGTMTLADDAGQTLSQDVATGSMQLVTTGWTRPSTTVTVSFTMGWSLGVDDLTYTTAP